MQNKVLETISRYSLMEKGSRVTVALSGGADSVALLFVLNQLSDTLGITLSAAHFNHRIRGSEADRDEQFVGELCKRLNIPLTVASADVPKYADEQGKSLELAARDKRYEFFASLDTDIIATAHNANDNLETVLFNLTRGTALKGLCGIPKRRGNIVRPLIECSRAEIEAYCSSRGIEYVTDSTNLCDDYSRNLIRHNVVPQLEKINPAVVRSVARMTDTLADDSRLVSQVVLQEYNRRITEAGLDVQNISSLESALARGVVLQYLGKLSVADFEAVHIRLIMQICEDGGAVSLPNGFTASAANGILKIKKAEEAPIKTKFSVKLTEQDSEFTENVNKIHKLFLNNTLDCDKIVGKSVVRTRQEGDSIRLYGRGCTKTLKKLFIEYKIPTCDRDTIPIVADDLGVVWVYGIGVSERCAVDSATKRIIKIEAFKE